MKYILVPFLVCLLNCKKYDKVDNVEIRKIDFATHGVVPLSCDSFDSYAFLIDTFYVKDSEIISNIISDINSATSTAEVDGLDARAKVLISYRSGKKDSVCIASYGVFVYHNQTRLFKNKRTLKFIDSLPVKDEW